jgi:ribose transport system permease protein
MNLLAPRHRPIVLAFLGLLVLAVAAGVALPGFLAASHLRSMIVLAAFIGLVGLGQTVVIIGGGIDLSVPWMLNSAAILVTLLAHGENRPLLWAMPLVLALGTLLGAANGLGVAAFGVPPIIMTLASNVILEGAILVHTGGAPTAAAPGWVQFLAVGRIGPLPVVLILWAALASLLSLVLSRTAFGRALYAVGTSAEVARFSGLPIFSTTVAAYAISGLSAALTGVLLSGYSGQAYLGMGDPYLFISVAAVAIGGTSILGGSGHYLGTVAGALVLTVLTSLLPALNLSAGALLVIYGVVILATVSLASESLVELTTELLARRRRGKDAT